MRTTEHPPNSNLTLKKPRVLLCAYSLTLEEQEHMLISRLITDLEAAGVEVVTDEMQDVSVWPFLETYQWILLIQPRDTASFALVEERLNTALQQKRQQDPPKIIHVIVSASLSRKASFAPNDQITFDASIDYQRALAAILLMLHPNPRAQISGSERGIAPLANTSHPATDRRYSYRHVASLQQRPLYAGLIILIALTLILGGVLVTHALTSTPPPQKSVSHPKSQANVAKTAQTPVKVATVIVLTPQEVYRQATNQQPVVVDSLQKQNGNHWDIGEQQQGKSCGFANKTYQVNISPPTKTSVRHICLAEGLSFTNFALQVDMKLLAGDVGGVVFRANQHASYYWFSLDANGCYRLVVLKPNGQLQILSNDQTSCLALTMKNAYQLTAIAQGSNIYLYINGQFIKQFIDATLTTGQIGFVAIARMHPTKVAFTNLKVWQL